MKRGGSGTTTSRDADWGSAGVAAQGVTETSQVRIGRSQGCRTEILKRVAAPLDCRNEGVRSRMASMMVAVGVGV